MTNPFTSARPGNPFAVPADRQNASEIGWAIRNDPAGVLRDIRAAGKTPQDFDWDGQPIALSKEGFPR